MKEICNNCFNKKICSSEMQDTVPSENTFCMRRFKLNYLYNEALIPEKLRAHVGLRADPVDTDSFIKLRELSSDIWSFVKGGQNLYIFSRKTGNGKTSWALRFTQNWLNLIVDTANLECKALFISVPRLLLALKHDISSPETDAELQQIRENILKADLVVWDDIGSKNGTTFEIENLFSFIDARLSLGKANIFTSNLDKSELEEALGNRLVSRIYGSSTVIELQGKDRRGSNK